MEKISAKVIENRMETPTVCVLRLKADIKPHAAGQYVMVYVNNEMKPYSIANVNEKDIVELCIKVVPEGHVSNLMAKMKKGDELEISQPMGPFRLHEDTKNKIVFTATGTGVSSLKPMADFLLENDSREIWLFLGVKEEKEIIYRKHFEGLQKKHKNFHFVPVCSRDNSWKGEKGYVQDAIKKKIKSPKEFDVYLCGVKAMVDELKTIAEQMGFANVYLEKYV